MLRRSPRPEARGGFYTVAALWMAVSASSSSWLVAYGFPSINKREMGCTLSFLDLSGAAP